jgi:thioredoxin reductase
LQQIDLRRRLLNPFDFVVAGTMLGAAALSYELTTMNKVTIAYRGAGFRRGKARNVSELTRLVDAGRVSLLFETEVDDIRPGAAVLRGRAGIRELPCDAVLVLIGNIPPWSTLREAGVRLYAEAALPALLATPGPPPEIDLANPP